jgi:hypothetical protein
MRSCVRGRTLGRGLLHTRARRAHRFCSVSCRRPRQARACVRVSRVLPRLRQLCECVCVRYVHRCALQEEAQRKRAAEAEAARKRALVRAVYCVTPWLDGHTLPRTGVPTPFPSRRSRAPCLLCFLRATPPRPAIAPAPPESSVPAQTARGPLHLPPPRARSAHALRPPFPPPHLPLQSRKPRVQAVRTERALIAHTMRMFFSHRTRPVPYPPHTLIAPSSLRVHVAQQCWGDV